MTGNVSTKNYENWSFDRKLYFSPMIVKYFISVNDFMIPAGKGACSSWSGGTWWSGWSAIMPSTSGTTTAWTLPRCCEWTYQIHTVLEHLLVVVESGWSGQYRFFMNSRVFESICRNCEKHNTSYLPLAFVLGFYTTAVINRWWTHWDSLPWPDTEGFWLASIVRGQVSQERTLFCLS
jgi:hypothetical protein